MMATSDRSLGGADVVYVSLVVRAFRIEEASPKPVLLEQLVERLARFRWGFEGSL